MTTRDIRDSPDISVDELYSRMLEKLHDVVPGHIGHFQVEQDQVVLIA